MASAKSSTIPKSKYIWALAFDKEGDLLVATGDPGAVHRVKPGRPRQRLYQSDETHVRSMAMDAAGNVILGTDPGGLVVRVSALGRRLRALPMSKREVTAVAVAKDGSIYAAGVGSKTGFVAGATAGPLPCAPAAPRRARSCKSHPPRRLPPPGSHLQRRIGDRIGRLPHRSARQSGKNLEPCAQDIVYAIAFDAQGRVLLGSGNKGYIYRIDSDVLYTALLDAPSTQITAFQTGADGTLYAATGNVGKIYRIGPGLAREGSLESEVFDAGFFSQWGRLSFEANLNGGGVAIAARSGNLDQPAEELEPLVGADHRSTKAIAITAPAARFVQWKATLTRPRGASNRRELESVDVAYLPRNVAAAHRGRRDHARPITSSPRRRSCCRHR